MSRELNDLPTSIYRHCLATWKRSEVGSSSQRCSLTRSSRWIYPSPGTPPNRVRKRPLAFAIDHRMITAVHGQVGKSRDAWGQVLDRIHVPGVVHRVVGTSPSDYRRRLT